MSKYKEGKVVTGCVTGIEDYGVFVNFDDYYTGLIHISEVSKLFVRNINDYVKLGQQIRCKILEVNDDEKHLRISIKDIDYQIGEKKLRKIVETPHGFKTLEEKLPVWIDEKLKEYNK
jgi:general stress protein 13